MGARGTSEENRRYYDAFAAGYEDQRGPNDPGGYHDLLDELESELVERFGRGKEVLEVGCGTGLILERIRQFAAVTRGVDLSRAMLEKASERGLDVVEGSATALPVADRSFDVTCSFKVLAHVPDVELALFEMARVTRPGGTILAEFYNPVSLRGLVKYLAPPGQVATGIRENAVYTRWDPPWRVRGMVPMGCELVGARGVRILTPMASVFRRPGPRRLFRRLERSLADGPLSRFGGFWIAIIKKHV
jgi:ubiquinone/menaquinone biosynthesis C-methylase UbiE